jgi:5'-nucleotidase
MTHQPFGCVGNTIRLRSGNYLDLADPQPDQFTLADIAGGLSKICRFGGQVERFYSVAEHSIWCARVGGGDGQCQDTQLALLMHDAAEAFVGDVVKPLKIMLGGYAEIEARVEATITEKYLMDFPREAWAIEEIDHAMLIAERRAMFSADQVTWAGETETRKLDIEFRFLAPPDAEEWFLETARILGARD